MTEPRTTAGRRLLEWDQNGAPLTRTGWVNAILAIEAEAAAGVHLGDEGLRRALERLHAFAKVEGWREPRGTMFEYVHHPDCDDRCWVVRALATSAEGGSR